MGIERPYNRIWRPMLDDRRPEYIGNVINSKERYSLSEAYNLIEMDLREILKYIQLSQDNYKTYSHRIYELFLRACTEFETNCKQILQANGYTIGNKDINKSVKNYSIKDYFLINFSSKLCDYIVSIDLGSERLDFFPFEEWKVEDNNKQESKGLTWYSAYNAVKHNRTNSFMLANLENLINSVCAVHILLISQFYSSTISRDRKHQAFETDNRDYHSLSSSMFWFKPPSWSAEEKYDFDCKDVTNRKVEFQNFDFNQYRENNI